MVRVRVEEPVEVEYVVAANVRWFSCSEIWDVSISCPMLPMLSSMKQNEYLSLLQKGEVLRIALIMEPSLLSSRFFTFFISGWSMSKG